MNLYEQFLSAHKTEPDWYYNNIVRKGLSALFHKQAQAYTPINDYYYMLTFTLNPRLAERIGAWSKKTGFRESYYDRVEQYIKKLANNKAWNLKFFAYVREGGDKEHKHTHWHVSIKCSKWFDFKKNLSYYEKLFGNVDKSVSKLSTNIHAKKYMSKQREPIILMGEFDEELDPNSPTLKNALIEWKTI